MTDINNFAQGQWPELLGVLAGLSPEQLTDKHQPCPLCSGTDRYRFDDIDGSGSWFCNQCGGKAQSGGAGSGMDLLMRVKGWDFKEAAKRVEEHLRIAPRQTVHRAGSGTVQTVQSPTTEPPTRGAENVWRYSDTFYVCRFSGKKIRPLTFVDGTWIWKAPIGGNRPLYNQAELAKRPDASVLIVEGEKTADAASKLFPSVVAISWSGGCKALRKSSWGLLSSRKVILWPDNDDPGRLAMDELADILYRLSPSAASVRLVSPPQDAPEGWDIADASWLQEEAASYVKDNIIATERTPDPEPDPEPIKPAKGGHFTCLGFDGDSYYYQPHRTGQVVRLARASHTGTNLCALAPLPYWETLYPSKTGANWTAAASSLFEQQAVVGVYSPDRIRGRGAWWDEGRAILHLGDRLIVNGAEQGITDRLPKSPYLYQRLAAIEGFTGLAPLTNEEAFPLLDLASRFHWEVPASGLLIAGWVTLAPICGAMEWRPHAWLTAAAGSGKSAILDRYVGPLLGPVALWPEGNTTEAFIRQELRADALPVVFDEAESNEKRDQDRIQSILSLARVSSSSGRGVIGKGSADGSSQRFIIRSMFLMSSIATALKQGADKSRFAQLTLRNPAELPKAERTAHWDALDRDLDRFITDDVGRRLLIRTTNLIPIIRESCKVFRRVAADRFDSQRLGDQYGTLLAGAWSLMSSQPATEAQARQMINENDWEPYSQATEVPDERRCIQRILQQQIRVESDRSNYMRTIGELVDLALNREMDMDIGASLAQATLGRHGVKVDGDAVLISNNAEAIATILRDTPWSNCWPTVLTRLPASTKAGSIYFKGSGTTSRAIRVPLAAIDRTDSA